MKHIWTLWQWVHYMVIMIPFSLQNNIGFQSVNNERKRLHFEPRHNNLKVDVSIIHILSILKKKHSHSWHSVNYSTHTQDDYNYDKDDGGDEQIIDFKRGPGQKGISKVDSNDLTQLGLIQTAEDQKTRDNGKDDHRSVNYT